MVQKNLLKNTSIISILAIVVIVLGITLLAPKLNNPTGAVTISTCGNGIQDKGETCGTCPQDIPCREGYSCINQQCEIIGLKPKGRQYCGYLPGYYTKRDKGQNIAILSTDFFQTCISQDVPSSTADKLVDNKYRFTENIWMCINKPSLTLPQYASIKLDKEYIINHARLLSSYLGNDDANVKEFTISISIDSTDGKNGHWRTVAKDKLKNTYEAHIDVFFDPVSAKWIKVTVNSLWNQPFNKFGLSELKIYEATYVCDSDYELNWNK